MPDEMNWHTEEVDRWIDNTETLYVWFYEYVLPESDDETAARKLKEMFGEGSIVGVNFSKVDWLAIVRQARES